MNQISICVLIIVSLLILIFYLSKYKGFIGLNERFINGCANARDGISGCRICCSKKYSGKYQKCVNNCMNN